MLHPVGTLPPVVYWRRRILLLAPLLLVVLTVYVACSGGGGGTQAGAPSTSGSSRPSPLPSPTPGSSTPPTAPTSKRAPSAATPTACAAGALKIAAVVGAPSYRIGAQPVLYLQVTNAGPAPCVEDLSDKQIELRVFNGASRVWGSHDCQIQPGSSPATLVVNQPVRRSITWTGLSSQPQQCANRQRVGAGTYTLHALLGGVEGSTATFTIS